MITNNVYQMNVKGIRSHPVPFALQPIAPPALATSNGKKQIAETAMVKDNIYTLNRTAAYITKTILPA